MTPDDNTHDGEAWAIPLTEKEWTDDHTRRLIDVATRPSRYLAVSCDVFTEVFDSTDDIAAGNIAGMHAGRAVVLGYGYDPEALMQFDGAMVMTPEVAMGVAERLMQAAVFCVTPISMWTTDGDDDNDK